MKEHVRLKKEMFIPFYKTIVSTYKHLEKHELALENYDFDLNEKFILKNACYDLYTIYFRVKHIEFLRKKFKKLFASHPSTFKDKQKKFLPLSRILKFENSLRQLRGTRLYRLYVLIQSRAACNQYEMHESPIKKTANSILEELKPVARPSEIIEISRIREALQISDESEIDAKNNLFVKVMSGIKFRKLELDPQIYAAIVYGLIDFFQAEEPLFEHYLSDLNNFDN